MKKYKLTPRGPRDVVQESGKRRCHQLQGTHQNGKRQLNLPEMIAELRIRSRKQVEFLLPVSDLEQPENVGLVYDLSENGVGTRGLKAYVHEINDVGYSGRRLFPC